MDAIRTSLTWADVEKLTGSLAAHLHDATGIASFDRVVGVARGGLIPAVLLASPMRIDRIETVQMRFYEGRNRFDAPRRVGGPPLAAGPSGDPTRTLVVDEMVDSGGTMRALHEMLPEATLVALVARNAPAPARRAEDLTAFDLGVEGAHVWTAGVLNTDAWILFPWSPPEDHAVAQGRA